MSPPLKSTTKTITRKQQQQQQHQQNKSTPLLSPLPTTTTPSPQPPPSSSSSSNPLTQWFNNHAWPGMGLFGESYLLFSIGTLRPIWNMLYPTCLQSYQICSERLVHSLAYSVVIGVISGMIIIGYFADVIGRRSGSLLTATFMSFASIGMTYATLALRDEPELLFLGMSVALFVFGVGVGGEYPLSAASASERSMGRMNRRLKEEIGREEKGLDVLIDSLSESQTTPTIRGGVDREGKMRKWQWQSAGGGGGGGVRGSERRGMGVLLVFTMQGMGIFLNSLTLTGLLALSGQWGDKGELEGGGDVSGLYEESMLLLIWRLVYLIGAVILLYVLVSRVIYLKESRVWRDDQRLIKRTKVRKNKLGEAVQSYSKTRDERDGAQEGAKLSLSFEYDGRMISRLKETRQIYTVDNDSDKSQPGDDGNHDKNNRDVAITLSLSSMSGEEEKNVQILSMNVEKRTKTNSKKLLFKYYWSRLLGTCSTWLLWDIAFYGNKLFQSSFIIALCGDDTTLFEISGAATLNAFVALLGYFAAASIVDNPIIGRLRLQLWGFVLTGSLFVLCGLYQDQLSSHYLVIMYFGSSFFGQCGPNATTFLIPAEIFPTELRSTCHGLSAAAGKVGALIAAVMFNYLTQRQLFFVSGGASFLAAVVTFFTIPDVTTLDLYEIDRMWRLVTNGREGDYAGAASEDEHLSFVERRRCC